MNDRGHIPHRVIGRTLESSACAVRLHWRWPIGVAEHRVEGMSKVIGVAAVVLLRHWQHERKDHQQEQEELEGQSHTEDAPQKASAIRRRLGIRREGNGSSVAAIPVDVHTCS